MSTVLEQIQEEIAKLDTGTTRTNVGRITTLADGVAKLDGLSGVMYNEMIEFPGGTIGNLAIPDAEALLNDVDGPVVAVGDVVTYHLRKASRTPEVAFIDGVPEAKARLILAEALRARAAPLSPPVGERG